jgi:hypothetical protein
MNGLSEDNTNVIEIKFGTDREVEIPNEISHPASNRYLPEDLSDDPLADLLGEFDDLENEETQLEQQEDYLFHVENYQDSKLEATQNSLEMSEILLTKIKKLKEDMKRTKYYLDELNLEE